MTNESDEAAHTQTKWRYEVCAISTYYIDSDHPLDRDAVEDRIQEMTMVPMEFLRTMWRAETEITRFKEYDPDTDGQP